MRQLTDFVNHGILPFVGRKDLLEGILTFWVETVYRGGLEAFLIEAPAGQGKSRLVEEIVHPIRARGGLLLRVRLYPETSASLLDDLMHQVSLAETRLHLPAPEGRTNLFARLRRLVRLRPTLLVIEDLHLLDGESASKISGIFVELEDEPLPLLLLSRPLSKETRSIIEPFLVRFHPLERLRREDLEDLWTRLFAPPSSDALIDLLMKATKGNPLAVRSGLRGLIDREMLVTRGERWELACTMEEYATSLQQHVRRLLEGMTFSLKPEEYDALLVLARLGEIFSHEAALTLLPEGDHLIDQLIFKGMLQTLETHSISLNGLRSNSAPLHFTHTLLHEHCRAQPIENLDLLLRPLLTEIPHYSYGYFRVLLEVFERIEVDRAGLEQAITSVRSILNNASHHPGWRNLVDVYSLFKLLVERGIEQRFWNEEESIFFRGVTLVMWTVAFGKRWREPEFASLSRELEKLTRDPQSDRMARMRLRALSQMVEVTQREKDDTATYAIDTEVESLLATFPALQTDDQYFYYLGRILQRVPHLLKLSHLAIDRYAAISKRVDELSDYQRVKLKRMSVHLLTIFRSQDEFRSRLELLASLENDPDVPDYLLYVHRESALLSGGALEPLLQMVEESRHVTSGFDDQLGLHSLYWIERVAWVFIGAEEGTIDQLLQKPAGDEMIYVEVGLWYQYNLEALARGMETTLEKVNLGEPKILMRFTSSTTCLLELSSQKNLPRIHRSDPLASLQSAIRGEEIAPERLADDLRGVLQMEPFQLTLVGSILAILKWSEGIGSREWEELDLEEDLLIAIDRWINRLAEAPAPLLIERLLATAGGRIGPKHISRYEKILTQTRKRAEKILNARLQAVHSDHCEKSDAIPRLWVIGEIQMMVNDELTRIRGAGIKRALAVMIADQILKDPMDFREIARLLSGDETVDPERGRKTVNNAIYKLRKLLGQDAFITERGEVRLNRKAIAIDLLEMTDLLTSAEKGLESGTIGQNLPDIQRALDFYGEGVIFPGLYDPFFEAVRSELEWRVRSLLLKAASLLHEQGDLGGAEDLLSRGVNRMPGDEEILEHLCGVLRAGGKFIEAERVRMRETA